MKKLMILLIAVGLFGTACNSEFKDIQVTADSESGFSISNYETYAWLGSARIMHDELGQWEPPGEVDADVEIRSLIDKRMTKQKMKINESNPDLIIGYAAGIDLDVMESNLQRVADAGVIGIPSAKWGESPLAVIVRKNDSLSAEELIQYCHGKLAPFKTVKAVEFVDEIPRNPSGKILKRDLREQYTYDAPE